MAGRVVKDRTTAKTIGLAAVTRRLIGLQRVLREIQASSSVHAGAISEAAKDTIMLNIHRLATEALAGDAHDA